MSSAYAAGLFPSGQALAALRAAARRPPAAPVPDQIVAWLARLRLLHGVPFAYLAVDGALVPAPESIRFFHIDRNWTDAACDGALSVAAGPRERAQLRTQHAGVRAAVDRQERNHRWTRVRPGEVLDGPADAPLTGFLLRSRLVSGWPGLQVRATRGGEPVALCRLDRLAPAVLLVLFDGIPDTVTVEEPAQGVVAGVDPAGDGYRVPARDGAPAAGVPFRAGSPGVIDVAELARRMGTTGSAAVARRWLQFPFAQDFTGVPDPAGTVFRPSITLAELDTAFGSQP